MRGVLPRGAIQFGTSVVRMGRIGTCRPMSSSPSSTPSTPTTSAGPSSGHTTEGGTWLTASSPSLSTRRLARPHRRANTS